MTYESGYQDGYEDAVKDSSRRVANGERYLVVSEAGGISLYGPFATEEQAWDFFHGAWEIPEEDIGYEEFTADGNQVDVVRLIPPNL